MKKNLFISGAVTALGTPLDENEDLHVEGMQKQVRAQLDAGINGLLVLGSMGVAQLLKERTCKAAIEVVVREVSGAVPVIAGCGDAGTVRALERLRWAEAAGADAAAAVSPYFFHFNEAEVAKHFRSLASQTELPLYLYNLPARTGHSLSFETIRELAAVPNIIGLKESGDLYNLRRCSVELQAEGGFNVLSGLTNYSDIALRLGAHGLIDGIFAAAPEFVVRLIRCFGRGDEQGVRAASDSIEKLSAVVAVDSIFGGFTAAMNLRGIPGNFAPAPFTTKSAEGERLVGTILGDLGLV